MKGSISSRIWTPGPCPRERWRSSDEHDPASIRDLIVESDRDHRLRPAGDRPLRGPAADADGDDAPTTSGAVCWSRRCSSSSPCRCSAGRRDGMVIHVSRRCCTGASPSSSPGRVARYVLGFVIYDNKGDAFKYHQDAIATRRAVVERTRRSRGRGEDPGELHHLRRRGGRRCSSVHPCSRASSCSHGSDSGDCSGSIVLSASRCRKAALGPTRSSSSSFRRSCSGRRASARKPGCSSAWVCSASGWRTS